ncbi:CHAT domain-containing protein [Limnofasciculus baicalensis]|uniref:CHAT domain-containing protein n=1 Tax=Limnofasciculus baicalensis BBK-W-15 TaxID=2699891 RepID=A0AAE3KMG7_9CYAN|nr:CHAT domain-containing protein [Limnofasciculus baicalensis]MCP2727633.1 CHAT domain-containing protein [Limnofasciculus baicalensis BBK-W-15]
MAKPIILFFRKVKFIIKYLFLTLAIILLITWGHGKLGNSAISPVFASTPPEELEIQANSITNEGHQQLALGENEEALKSWEEAMKLYEELGNKEGVIGSIVNQSIALQALGQYRRACQVLLPAVDIDSQENICDASSEVDKNSQEQCQDKINEKDNSCANEGDKNIPGQSPNLISAIALRTFGDALRNIGNLDLSMEALEISLKIAQEYKSDVDISAALLSLGNTERGLYKREVDRYNRSNSSKYKNEAKNNAEQALDYYREVSNYSGNKITQIQAKINRLSLLLEFDKWLNEEKPNREAEALVPEIESEITSLPESVITVYTKLNFAEILSLFSKKYEAIQYANDALQQGQKLNNKRAEAYAIGTIGGLYEEMNDLSEAQKLTEKASTIAKSILAYDITYQWEWQLGRIYRKQGNIEGAIAVYDAAVKDLQIVRQDLLSINIEEQFSFRDNVEPVYREFVDLLLGKDGTSQPSQDNLKRAIEAIDSLQVAELENFLGCNLLLKAQRDREIYVDPKAAFIYAILLEDRLEVIFQLPEQPLINHKTFIDQIVVKNTLSEMLKFIVSGKGGETKQTSKEVYKWLLQPLEKYLEQSDTIETLVFVLDGDLRNIPMSVLYDEENNEYLIQKKYALVLLPSSKLFDLQPLARGGELLGAGISESIQVGDRNFHKINVTNELQTIQNTVSSSQILQNSEFTRINLQQKLASGDFSLIHLATHGNFSSDPEETYILIHGAENNKGELLRAKDLNNLLRSTNEQFAQPIELLVLSACKTAEGDDRATLGLAGLAVRSGVRSTVATLWQVNDESTVKLMENFYKNLSDGVPKGEALHLAQQSLLDEAKYRTPDYWAAYILVGNWL